MAFLFGGSTEIPQDTKDEKALKHLQLINDAQFLHKEVALIEAKILDRIKKRENERTILKDIDEKDIRAHLLEAKKLIAKTVNTYPNDLAHLKDTVSIWSFEAEEVCNQNESKKSSSKSHAIGSETKLLYSLQQMKDILSIDLLLISYCSTNQVIGIDDVPVPGRSREINELELLDNLKHPKHGLDVKNRKYLLKTYENCFIGREAIDWMMDRKYAASRYEAVTILNRFIKYNEIAHVLNEHEFKDEYLFYRFADTPPTRAVSQFGSSQVQQQQEVLTKALKHGSCLEWWSNEVKDHVVTIILFISFDGSLFSKVMLKSWNQLVDDIRDAGGEIYGVTSDPQTAADLAKSEWKLRFDILSDPLNTLAANYAHITKSGSTGGIAHPGVMASTKFKRVLYEWYVNPHLERLGVDMATPLAADSWGKILLAMKTCTN